MNKAQNNKLAWLSYLNEMRIKLLEDEEKEAIYLLGRLTMLVETDFICNPDNEEEDE